MKTIRVGRPFVRNELDHDGHGAGHRLELREKALRKASDPNAVPMNAYPRIAMQTEFNTAAASIAQTTGHNAGKDKRPSDVDVEDSTDVLERLTREHMAANPGMTKAQAMSEMSLRPEFSAALQRERVDKFGS